MMTFLATYEIGKAKSLIKDEDIMTKVKERCEKTNRDYLANPSALFTQQLKMDLSVTDVPDRVSKYFQQFEKIITENGFHEFLGRGAITDDDYVARMKQRTKILVDNLAPTELVKSRHIRINDQSLYKLILEHAELQQLFFNRFRAAESNSMNAKPNNRKGGKTSAIMANCRQTSAQRRANGDKPSGAGSSGSTQSLNPPNRKARQRPPQRTGCLHCKGEHGLRGCPVATPEEKEVARKAHMSKSWKVKRSAVCNSLVTAND
ncbi:hypothetical protein L916_18102 [Phytophthora nicotianae]|uniref:Retrotransposon gag domain-containing protein n=1 Tax=Phytophthora nicotianae TaxID=4792 RepID=W2I5D8_PHYNI|nr:hypothetical protein L916_18102 [Phytophthora nicotianae]